MTLANIIDGKSIASNYAASLRAKAEALKSQYKIQPKLAVILVGNDPASQIYVTNKVNKGIEIGIKVDRYNFPDTISQDELVAKIKSLDSDKSVHGILVQLPLPEHLDQNAVINTISAPKDVDGFTVQNIGLLNSWQDCLEPSTPQGILILIKKALGDNLVGKKAVVLGRSLIVGRPTASILVRESCTVTLLHSKSQNIEDECKTADILISAIGSPLFIKANLIKPGACVIDVGIRRIEDKIYGDVDFESVSKVAGYITPVPGGVGPMTVICMLANTLKACCIQNGIELGDEINS